MQTRTRRLTTFTMLAIVSLIAFTIPRGASAKPTTQAATVREDGPGDPAAQFAPLLKAIRLVESDDNPSAVGDHGKALGAYQIHFDYWKDAKIGGVYRNVTDRDYATGTVVQYWRRYCPDALRNGDFKTLAMTHHGGPSGSQDADYWRKIERALSGAT
jgi:hypothetical protein